MSLLRRKGSDTWHCSFKVESKTYRRSTGFKDRKRALVFERQLHSEVVERVRLGVVKPITLRQAVQRFESDVLIPRALQAGHERNLKRERYTYTRLLSLIDGDTDLDQIGPTSIADIRSELLREGKAAATVNRYLNALSTVLRKAERDWRCLAHTPRVGLLKLQNKRERYLTVEEEQRLLALAKPHLRDLIVFLVDTGARKSEATTLTWNRVDFRLGQVSFVDTKNGKPRSVPMTNRVRSLLKRLLDDRPNSEPRVFLVRNTGSYRTGGRPTHSPFREPHGSFKTACRKAELINVRIHDLRHTFASRLVSSGVPLLAVAQLLGHQDIRMTERYAHLGPNHLADSIARLNSLNAPADSGYDSHD